MEGTSPNYRTMYTFQRFFKAFWSFDRWMLPDETSKNFGALSKVGSINAVMLPGGLLVRSLAWVQNGRKASSTCHLALLADAFACRKNWAHLISDDYSSLLRILPTALWEELWFCVLCWCFVITTIAWRFRKWCICKPDPGKTRTDKDSRNGQNLKCNFVQCGVSLLVSVPSEIRHDFDAPFATFTHACNGWLGEK